MEELPKNLQQLFAEDLNYFSFRSIQGEKVFASCKLCLTGKDISGGRTASSNFLSHLKNKHLPEYNKLVENKKHVEGKKRKSPDQPTLDIYKIGETKGLDNQVEKLIVRFIVSSMSPVSIVEDEGFRGLLQHLSPSVNIPRREKTRNKIFDTVKILKKSLIMQMKNVNYISLTADAWSSRKRGFLGVTAHWIEKDLTRKSAILACQRFMGTHSFDRVAQLLSSVMEKYEIPWDKVVGVVTDNGSNFVKAFDVYGVQISVHQENDDDNDGEDEDLEWFELDDLVAEDNNSIKLPPHFRCAPHTLSLVASQEPLKISDKRLMHSSMAKCSALWNKSWSPKSAEIIEKHCNKQLLKPCPTRWNSLFDALQRLLEVKDNLDDVCEELKIPVFRKQELEYLSGYQQALKPIASALDTLQGDKVFLGDFLPEILNIIEELGADTIQSNIYAKPLAEKLMQGIKKRFGDCFDFTKPSSETYAIAAISHPFFKLRWLPTAHQEHAATLKSLFFTVCHNVGKTSASSKNLNVKMQETDALSAKAMRFRFDNSNNSDSTYNQEDRIQLECLKYFEDKRVDLEMLLSYPTVLEVFLKFNTNLPSSAPVERVFSYAGMILGPKRSRLSDELFEALVLLKCNN